MKYKLFTDIENIPENYKYIETLVFNNEEETQIYYLAEKIKEKNRYEKILNNFIENYKYPAIIKSSETTDSYKIIKGVSYTDLLKKLKKFEDNLKDKWKIISDVQVEIIKGIKIYFVEIAKINYEFLENL